MESRALSISVKHWETEPLAFCLSLTEFLRAQNLFRQNLNVYCSRLCCKWGMKLDLNPVWLHQNLFYSASLSFSSRSQREFQLLGVLGVWIWWDIRPWKVSLLGLPNKFMLYRYPSCGCTKKKLKRKKAYSRGTIIKVFKKFYVRYTNFLYFMYTDFRA